MCAAVRLYWMMLSLPGFAPLLFSCFPGRPTSTVADVLPCKRMADGMRLKGSASSLGCDPYIRPAVPRGDRRGVLLYFGSECDVKARDKSPSHWQELMIAGSVKMNNG